MPATGAEAARPTGAEPAHVAEAGPAHVAVFEANRPRLFGLAYRLLGTASEAEDAVQDAYLRWDAADRAAIRTPAAWLTKVVTNLCLNQLTSARARRECYVGPWLPEPVLTDLGSGSLGPLETAEQRESVSMALLTLMERLTPSERAVFVLREAFAYSHRDVAEILGVQEPHARQLHRRARQRLGEPEPRRRFPVDGAQRTRIVQRFFAATLDGDIAGLERLLAEDVVAWADGGGEVTAARRPITGREKVLRYLLGLARRPEAAFVVGAVAEVNGGPAVVLTVGEGGPLVSVVVPEVVDGRIVAVRTVAAPGKLAFAATQLA
ncbi:RNA polymerase sigma-70 factor [Streptomyces sp. P1-3]|uniref:RNA polymerase sigma-70 factor n=1 Tax=Streptomyces sp. P1-3 TaxID=3421658 RepID=UPI003D369791